MADISKINLNGSVYNIVDSATSSALTAEIERAQAAESANTSAITLEVAARQSAVTALETAISGKADASTTYTKTEVDNAITAATSGKQDTLTAGEGISISGNVISCDIDTTLYVVVTELPAQPAAGNENKIHLVPLASGETQNMYAEYLWKGDAWEKLGEKQIETDLSNYYNKTEVDNLLSAKTDNSTYTAYTGATETRLDNLESSATTAANHIANTNNPHSVTAAQLGISASYSAATETLILTIPTSA